MASEGIVRKQASVGQHGLGGVGTDVCRSAAHTALVNSVAITSSGPGELNPLVAWFRCCRHPAGRRALATALHNASLAEPAGSHTWADLALLSYMTTRLPGLCIQFSENMRSSSAYY